MIARAQAVELLADPAAWAAVLIGLFVLLLAGLALGLYWFETHGEVLWRLAARVWRPIAGSAPAVRARQRYPRLWRLLSSRLSPQHYLGLHLTLGLAVSVCALAFFAVIAVDVPDREQLIVVDDVVFNTLRENATEPGTRALAAISRLGDGETLAVLGFIGAVGLAVARRRTILIGWVAALAGAFLLDATLKPLFQRVRPEGASDVLGSMTWSFPSGHALSSLIAYGMLAYLAVAFFRSRLARAAVIAGAAVLVLAIGLSRLYLGVHYFTDVVAGFAAGAVWLSACVSGLEVARRRRLSSTRDLGS